MFAGSYGKPIFSSKKLPNFSKVAFPFCISTSKERQSSCCSTPLLAFGVLSVPDFGYSYRCIMVFRHFIFHFPNDKWYAASLYTLMCHLYIFCKVCLLRCFAHFLIGLFPCWFLNVFIYFGNSLLSGIFYKFSSSLFPLFLTLSFADQKFFIFIKSSVSGFIFMDLIFSIVSRKSLAYPR